MLRNLLVTSSPLKLPILSNLPVVVVLNFIDLHTLVQSVTLCTVRLVFLTHFIINVVSEFSEFSYKFIITYGCLRYSFEVFLNSSWLLQFFEPMHCNAGPEKFLKNNGISLPKLFWPTVRKMCSSGREKLFKIFEITRTIYPNSARPEQFLVNIGI